MTGAALAQSAPAALSTAPVAPAGADSASASGSTAENIVVTGSRLKSSNATSEAPVVIVTAAQIEHTQAQTLEDVLTKLPEIGTSGLYSTTNNGGGGVSCVELRNLGLERTLVLVDGKRFVDGNANCVDLNNIPLEQVDQIEILKDGASTTYGADAIAGVINIKLKHNFSGAIFHANGSIATDAGDDKGGELSVLTGTNFDHGNFTVGLDYLNQGPVQQSDRSFAQFPVQSDRPLGSGKQTVGSIFNPNGLTFSDTNTLNVNNYDNLFNIINKNGTLGAPYTGAQSQRFNFGALQQLALSLEKESITTTSNYDFSDYASGFIEAFYTHKKTAQQLAPQPVSGSLPGSGLPDAFVVPEGNPGLTALLGPGSGPVDLYKRETQFGDRHYTQVDNTFQINTGFKGDLGAGWNYEVFFQYGEDDDQTTNTNNINFLHVENQVGFQQTVATPAQQAAILATTGAFDSSTFGIYNPTAVCLASAGCTVANPFGQKYTAAQIAYDTYTEAQQSRYTLKVYGGNVTNNELFHLPAGPVGVSLGVEHRTESGEFTPDSLDQTGEGLGSTARPTNGSFDVTEVYGETRIPILKDLPGRQGPAYRRGRAVFRLQQLRLGRDLEGCRQLHAYRGHPLPRIRWRGLPPAEHKRPVHRPIDKLQRCNRSLRGVAGQQLRRQVRYRAGELRQAGHQHEDVHAGWQPGAGDRRRQPEPAAGNRPHADDRCRYHTALHPAAGADGGLLAHQDRQLDRRVATAVHPG